MKELQDIDERLRGPSASRVAVVLPAKSSVQRSQGHSTAASPVRASLFKNSKPLSCSGRSQAVLSTTCSEILISNELSTAKSTPSPPSQLKGRRRGRPKAVNNLSSISQSHRLETRKDDARTKTLFSNSIFLKTYSAPYRSHTSQRKTTPLAQSTMDKNNPAAAEAAGRPQRERTPTAKMLALTSSADFFPLFNYGQGQMSKATAATDADDGTSTAKRGRGRPRKDESITLANRSQAKASTSRLQAQIEGSQAQTSASSEAYPIGSELEYETQSEVESYIEESRAFYAQIKQRQYSHDPIVPLPNSNPLQKSDTPDAEAAVRKQSQVVSSAAGIAAESEVGYYLEESGAFYNQLPFSIDPSVPRTNANPFEPTTSDAGEAAIEQPQAVPSEKEEGPATPAAFPSSLDLPPAQPQLVFNSGPAKQGESGRRVSFDGSRFHAVRKAPTAQNQNSCQNQSFNPPRITQIMDIAPSNVRFLDHNEEMNAAPGFASGSGISAAAQPQQNEQIDAEPGEPRAESCGSKTLSQVPNVRIDGVQLADIDEFIRHFVGYVGVANPPRGPDESLDGMIKVLTNWNSIFTIRAAPLAEDSHLIGDQVGLHLAIRLVCKGHAGLLKPLADYFQGLVQLADAEIQTLSNEDMIDYEENAEMSWLYMQLMQREFAKQARVKVIEIAKTEALKQQEAREMRRRVTLTGGIGIVQTDGGSKMVQATPGTLAVAEKGKENRIIQAASGTSNAAETGKEGQTVQVAADILAAVDKGKGKGKEEDDGLDED